MLFGYHFRTFHFNPGGLTQNEVDLIPGFRAPERNLSLIVPVGKKGFDLQENKMLQGLDLPG